MMPLHGMSVYCKLLEEEHLGNAYLLVLKCESFGFCEYDVELTDRDDLSSAV